MTTIRATCPECNEVDLKPDDVRIEFTESSYSFYCPGCMHHIEKTADSKIVSLLRSAGVMTLLAPVHPEVIPDGGVLTLDDLLDFHQSFEYEIEQLLEGTHD